MEAVPLSSYSTPEAETIATCVLGKRTIPLHMISQRMRNGRIRLSYLADNTASERVIGTGVSSALAYMKRTAGISLQWAKENMAEFLKRTPSDENLADIFTKPLESDVFHAFRIRLGIF